MPLASPPGAPREGFKEFVPDDMGVSHRRRKCLGIMTWERWQQEREGFPEAEQKFIDNQFAEMKRNAK